MRVLLVVKNSPDARDLEKFVGSIGAVTDSAQTGVEALELAKWYDYDIILLAFELADLDGIEVIKRLRAARVTTPIIMISNAVRADCKIKALSVGADDFVVRPYDALELSARIQAVVRRSKGFSQSTIKIGELLLNLNSKEVVVNGTALHLTGKEYAILELLALRKGSVLTKEAFLNHLYGGIDEPEMKIIDVFVCKLRKKLAHAGVDGLIGTVWGRGYMMKDVSGERVVPIGEPPAHKRVHASASYA